MSKSRDFGNILAVAAAVAAFIGSGGNPVAAKVAFALAIGSAVQQSAYQKQKMRALYNASLTDRTVMTATYAGVRSRVYGRARNVDGIVLKGTRGSKSEIYTLVIAVAGHEVADIETVYFNDQAVTIDGAGQVSSAPYGYTRRESKTASVPGVLSYDVGPFADLSSVRVWHTYANNSRGSRVSVDYTISGTVISWVDTEASQIDWQQHTPYSKATVKKYTGAPGQDLSGELMSRFPGLVNASHKFAGIACLLVDLEYDENAFTGGIPQITALIKGAKDIYDPRSGLTGWTDNPALCARDWAGYEYGGGCDADEIDDASFIAAANACDVSHTYVDSNSVSTTRPMFRCGYVCKLDISPEAHFGELIESMGGRWAWSGGRLRVRAGVYTTPVATIDESWLSETTGSRQIIPEVGVHELVNSYRITISDSQQSYNSTQLAPLAPSAYLAEDGYELPAEIEMGAVQFGPQALHIGGILLRDQRDGLTITWPCNMKAWALEVFDVVYLNSSRYGWANKAFEVITWAHSPMSGIRLTLKETGPSIFTPDAVFAAGDQIPNTALPKPWDLPVIAGLSASSGTDQLVVGNDGSILSRVKLTFDPINNQSVLVGGTIEVAWNNGSEWVSRQYPGDSSAIYLTDVQDDNLYLIKARCRNKLASGDWCSHITHTVIGKTEKPPTVDAFTIATQPDGTRILSGGYTAANKPIDLAGYRIRYRQGSGPFTWDAMTPFQNDTGFFTALPIETNQILAGTYTLAIVGVDTTGNESATPLMISSTLPNPRLGSALQYYAYEALGWPGSLSQGVIDVDAGVSVVRASDQATWATLPSTWAAWTRWVWTPYTSWSYTPPAADFGALVSVLPVVNVECVGSYVVEEQHSADNVTWTSWAAIASPFNARYARVRVTVTATGPTGAGVTQVTMMSAMSVIYTGKVTSETVNDINPAALTGANRIGTGDIRLPLGRSYASISRVSVTIQSVTGNWSWTLLDKTTTGPRVQFYNSSGVLADPPLIDFTVEGIAS